MASMLFNETPAGATLQNLQSLRNQIVIAVENLRRRRESRKEGSFVIVGGILRTWTGDYFFVIQFPDKDTRAPKVVKKVVCRARRAYNLARFVEQMRPDPGWFGLGYSIA